MDADIKGLMRAFARLVPGDGHTGAIYVHWALPG